LIVLNATSSRESSMGSIDMIQFNPVSPISVPCADRSTTGPFARGTQRIVIQ
jgi:hypothetical protein